MEAGAGDPLVEQTAYYHERAAEYDDWFERRGRYDRGPDLNRQWKEETDRLRRALRACTPRGKGLELACGTGIWTAELLAHLDSLTVVDASSRMLERTKQRVGRDRIRSVEADLFRWRPDDRYDFVFFGFWLSHVPPERFDRFWHTVESALKPDGRVFFVDSRHEPTSTAVDHTLRDQTETFQERRLNDGRVFKVVKVFYDPEEAKRRLSRMGWEFRIEATAHYFIYGSGARRSS